MKKRLSLLVFSFVIFLLLITNVNAGSLSNETASTSEIVFQGEVVEEIEVPNTGVYIWFEYVIAGITLIRAGYLLSQQPKKSEV